VDARIEIVWPHATPASAGASLANITAYLFEAGAKRAIPPTLGWTPTVRLHRALNTEPEGADVWPDGQTSTIGVSRTVTTDSGIRFLAWDFNDVDISAAQDSLNKLYFWVSVDDGLALATYPNIWAHGVDARTIFPQADLLNSCK